MPLTAEEKKAKAREYSRKYYEQHKEEVDARHKRWKEANKEKVSEYQRKYMNMYNAKYGGYMYPKRQWQDWEIALVLDHDLTNAELSSLLERSANAINAKRVRVRKQLEMLNLSWE